MSELHCREFDDDAAELALGVLVGRERAAALEHLEGCPRCQRVVADLSATADRLLELTPHLEPPSDLEQRIMAGMGPRFADRTDTGREDRPAARPSLLGRGTVIPLWRRFSKGAGLAAAFLLGGLVLGGPMLGGDAAPAGPAIRLVPAPRTGPASPIPTENIVLYAPLTEGDIQVGQAYLYDGAHDWMYLSLDSKDHKNGAGHAETEAPDTNVTCTLVRPDGSTTPLGTFVLRHGQGSWAGAAPDPTGTSPTARVVDSAGRLVATAHFTDSDDPPPASQVPSESEPGPESGPGPASSAVPSGVPK